MVIPFTGDSDICAFASPLEPTECHFIRLTQEGKNHNDENVLTLEAFTSKSIASDDQQFAPRNVTDGRRDTMFVSQNQPNQWICLDFHRMRVRISHYIFCARSEKSWILEGSVDGTNWTEMDEHSDQIPGICKVTALECLMLYRVPSTFSDFRFLRFTQVGKNYANENVLTLFPFEVFGTVLIPADQLNLISAPDPDPPQKMHRRSLLPSGLFREVEFPNTERKPVDGIIAFLTRNAGGNVHDKGIVTITSKSVYSDDPRLPPGILLISHLPQSLCPRTGQINGFARISTRCASVQVITHSAFSP
jgi:hypothetical protein